MNRTPPPDHESEAPCREPAQNFNDAQTRVQDTLDKKKSWFLIFLFDVSVFILLAVGGFVLADFLFEAIWLKPLAMLPLGFFLTYRKRENSIYYYAGVVIFLLLIGLLMEIYNRFEIDYWSMPLSAAGLALLFRYLLDKCGEKKC